MCNIYKLALRYYCYNICINYVTSVRCVAGINHEARGCAAPEGRVIIPETYRTADVTLVIYDIMKPLLL